MAWDQRGFGRTATSKSNFGKTGGTDKALEDIDHFVKQMKEEAEKEKIPLFLWGHSMVCNLTMCLTIGRGIGVDVC